MAGIFDFIVDIGKTIISPITTLIDDLNTSDEEKLTLRNELQKMNLTYQAKLLELDAQLLDSKTKIIVAEAQGKSWLQRNWRPMIMVLFGFVILYTVLAPAFGLPQVDMTGVPTPFWTLLTVGIGGYIGGRSWEKVSKKD